jgi:uncharacterized protein
MPLDDAGSQPAANSRTERFIECFVRAVIAWRWPLLGLAAFAAAVCYVPAQQLELDRSIENMFAPGDPLLEPYHLLKRAFGANEVVLAAYVDPNLMTTTGLARLRGLAGQLEAVPGVAAVLSLAGEPFGDAIVDADNPLSRSLLELFEGYTVGADRQTAAVVCLLDQQAGVRQADVVDALGTIVARHDAGGTIVGEPVMVVDGFRLLDADGRRLGRVSLVLLVGVIVLLFRSLRWVAVPLAVVLVSITVTEGIVASSSWRLTMVSSMLASIVTIIAIATVVHLIVHFRELRAGGLGPRDALTRSGIELAAPIFWACATDAAGFGALIAAEVEPVHDFGWMMLIGSLVVLPALVTVVPGLALAGRFDADPRRAWGEDRLDLGLDRLSSWIEKRPRVLWSATALAGVLATLGCARLQVETDFTKNFRAESRVVRSYEFVENHLGGAGVWDILVPAPAVLDADFLDRLARLERELRGIKVLPGQPADDADPGLTKVLSVADALEAVTLGNLARIPLPALRESALRAALGQMEAQMPEFYHSLVARDPRDPGRSLVRVMLRSRERQESQAKQQLIADVERASQAAFPGAEVTGFFVLLTGLIQSTTSDQWLTFGLATTGILLMMLCAFRSPVLAVVAIVPNALPVFMVSGLLGWLGLKINMGSAMIAAASMGLSVDSSAHYITAYLALRSAGLGVHPAISAANRHVGRAMIFSTAALVAGFSALCFSNFVPTIYFGALMGLTMLGGLAGNLVVLPLLLAAVHRDRPRDGRMNTGG